MHRYFFIISLFLFSPLSAFAVEYVFCNTCTTETEFQLHAKGHHGNIVGVRHYQVINYVTEELWNVTVEGWRDDFDGVNYYGGAGIFMSTAFAAPAPQQDISDFTSLKAAIEGDHLVILPTNPDGGASFGSRTQEFVGGGYSSSSFGTINSKKSWFMECNKKGIWVWKGSNNRGF